MNGDVKKLVAHQSRIPSLLVHLPFHSAMHGNCLDGEVVWLLVTVKGSKEVRNMVWFNVTHTFITSSEHWLCSSHLLQNGNGQLLGLN